MRRLLNSPGWFSSFSLGWTQPKMIIFVLVWFISPTFHHSQFNSHSNCFSGIQTKVKSIGGHTALVVAMEWKRELVVKVFHLHLFNLSVTWGKFCIQ